eukprot:6218539-Amphidinium_carterae.6
MCECTMNPDTDYLDNSTFQFDMVAKHLQLGLNFDMVAELAFTMRGTTKREIEKNNEIEEESKENKQNMYNDEDKDIDAYDKTEEKMQTLNIYEMDKGTISVLGKMNIKLPSPTLFDGRYPQFNEWAGEVKAYMGVHNVNIEDIMGECTKSVTVIVLNDIQDKYTADEVT